MLLLPLKLLTLALWSDIGALQRILDVTKAAVPHALEQALIYVHQDMQISSDL